MTRQKITIHDIQGLKARGEPIAMITAYDYPSGVLAERAGVEMVLVGDSLGMVVHGFASTVPVTLDMMVLHCAAVARAGGTFFLIGDMPFGSYEISPTEATRHAVRLMKEGHADAIKLEGGREMADTVRAISAAGIPVQGHIGLTPQSASKLGGFKVQGKTARDARRLLDDAIALQDAGCFSIVLEAVPDRVAAAITERLDVPTIGIGAGAGCSGQVLVWHDMLGLFDRFLPKFAHRFADAGTTITEGLTDYVNKVKAGEFPAASNSFTIKQAEWEAFESGVGGGEAGDSETTALYGR